MHISNLQCVVLLFLRARITLMLTAGCSQRLVYNADSEREQYFLVFSRTA